MRNKSLIDIESYLSDKSSFDFLKSLNAEDALDLRDEPSFDEQWMKTFNVLENEKISDVQKSIVNTLREKAFKQSFRVLNNSEISSRISDDIEIIAKSFIFGKIDNWAIKYLWESYKNKEFPCE